MASIEPHVFISYSKKDRHFAQHVVNAIQNAEFTTWKDSESIRGGQDWQSEIDEAIKSSFAIVVIQDFRSGIS